MQLIADLIDRGGVYFNVQGSSPDEAIRGLIEGLRLPPSMDKPALLRAVLERESLMPTALGGGIAIPHPRNPMVGSPGEERIVLGYTRQPIDFRALDDKPVYALFLILSASQKSHLNILSRLSFLLHDQGFNRILERKPAKPELLEAIRSYNPSAG